ncbi:MAG: ATP-binding protein [Mobilitalea sp.]
MTINLMKYIFEYRFIIELFILGTLFTLSYEKRKIFPVRVITLILASVVIAIIYIHSNIDNSMQNAPFTITRYIALFMAVVAGINFCFKTTLLTSVFCVTGVYAIQHLFYALHEIVMEGYGAKKYIDSNVKYLIYIATYMIIGALIFTLFYHIFIRKFKNQYFNSKIIIVLCVFVNLYATVFSIIVRLCQENAQTEIFIICLLLDILCCLFTMYLLFFIFRTRVLQDELNIIESLLQKEKEHFSVSQKNIQMINIKCHDLKHQLSHLSKKVEASEIEELKKAILIYDMPMTGNQVLDIVIAEKRLQCEREEIELTCMADGEKLNFMSEADIFSLFGNALDNSINSVKHLVEKDKRIISMIVKESIGLISIHIENYYQGDLIFEDGLPVTTNKDKDYHGFGMKSIKYLVDKYSGELSIKLNGDIFNINIVFPKVRIGN